MITFVTGGERSGKSKFAQQLALANSPNPTYLATARRWDQDFEKRIIRHQHERDERWTLIEEEVNISKIETSSNTIVLDCITLWLTNIFTDQKYATDNTLQFAKAELERVFSSRQHWIIVSNEIGMGVHAASEMGRKFVELQGWINQYVAQSAESVYFMVSGIPLKIKPQ